MFDSGDLTCFCSRVHHSSSFLTQPVTETSYQYHDVREYTRMGVASDHLGWKSSKVNIDEGTSVMFFACGRWLTLQLIRRT